MAENREYKNDVFCMLMEDKRNALRLYNAINDSNYENPDEVEICNLEKGVSLTVRNDAAFILDMNLSVYEHQSTVCPNMPVRSLIYFSNILERRIRNRNIYGNGLVKIPTPRFAVFYNGAREQPEYYELKLSDAFEHPVDVPELELICRVYNINYGKNEELLNKCSFLREYMMFVDYVREYHRESDYEKLEHAIECAIDRCVREDILKDFLMEHRAEVVKVTQLDYTFDRQLMLEREDAREEGRMQGLEEGRMRGRHEGKEDAKREMVAGVLQKIKDLAQVAELLGIPIEEVQQIAEDFTGGENK